MTAEQAAPSTKPLLRVAMILPGLGRVQRGAETAFLEIARGLAAFSDVHVELFGSGSEGPPGVPFHQTRCVPRERFEKLLRLPMVRKVPALRTEYHYEELTYVARLAWSRRFQPRRFDAVIACTFPYVNWYLQLCRRGDGLPLQIFVTQNGDWMCQASSREYRLFRCDGLVCINPIYFERHRHRYKAALIPNGVDPVIFAPSSEVADAYQDDRIPSDPPVVFASSALITSKNVADAIRGVAKVPEAFLLVVGDGPERQPLAELARQHLPGRHLFLGSVHRSKMASLYRRASAFLHMSQDEPFGIVYLEAASTALPCVVHDGEVQHWILGDTALYCNVKDPQSVADCLRRALAEGRSIGARARHRVMADWTWQAQAAKYRQLLLELMAAPRTC